MSVDGYVCRNFKIHWITSKIDTPWNIQSFCLAGKGILEMLKLSKHLQCLTLQESATKNGKGHDIWHLVISPGITKCLQDLQKYPENSHIVGDTQRVLVISHYILNICGYLAIFGDTR